MKYSAVPEDSKRYSGEEMPNQLLSTRAKGKTWKEANAKYLTSRIFARDGYTKRKSPEEMQHYYDVLHGIVDAQDLQETFDPMGVNRDTNDMPENTVAYNPLKKGFRILFNEAAKRKVDVKAVAVNPEVINQKDREYRDRTKTYFQGLQAKIEQGGTLSDEELKKELDNLSYWAKHDLQSAHEVMANQLIAYLTKTPSKRLKYTTDKAFQDLTVIGEQIYAIGANGDDPIIRKVNNKQFVVLGLGNSDYIEDGSAWIEWDYLPKHKVIEEFGGKLTKAEIETIEKEMEGFYGGGHVYELVDAELSSSMMDRAQQGKSIDVSVKSRSGGRLIGSQYIDADGNILVSRFQWISQRKLLEVSRPTEDGEIVKELLDEYYEVREDKGETAEVLWVNELWEGKRIGESVYKDIQPAISQMRSILNPAVVRPYYVGSILSYGDDNKASSIMDDLLVWKKDFDLTANKLRKLWAQHKGQIMRISKSRIPKDMGFDEWFRWLSVFNISIEDDFNMSPESGAFAGNMQAQSPIIPLSVANEIVQAINMLRFYQEQIDNYMSTPPSRSGELKGNEGLGVTQQSIIGATLSTEDLYMTHEATMLRLFEVWIEFIKQLWKDDNRVMQYLLDDLSQYIFTVEGNTLQEAEFSVVMTQSSALRELERDLTSYGQAFAQNGTISMTDLLSVRLASSPSELIKRLENAEERTRKQQQDMEAQKSEQAKQLQQMQIEAMDKAHEREKELIILKGEMDIRREQARWSMGEQSKAMADENGDGVVDDIELKKANIESTTKKDVERMKLEQEMKIHEDEMRIAKRDLEIKAKAAQMKKSAAK